jgi:hypothetical protein
VIREINVLRPPQRRRIFFVLISPSMRTMDAHAAFLSNVNLVVNVADVDELHASWKSRSGSTTSCIASSTRHLV